MVVGARRTLPLRVDCLCSETGGARSKVGCQGDCGFWGADSDLVTGQQGQSLYG